MVRDEVTKVSYTIGETRTRLEVQDSSCVMVVNVLVEPLSKRLFFCVCVCTCVCI